MGRGRGGYTSIQESYKDSGGQKVTDKGAIYIGEKYIKDGYETVFRRRHEQDNNDEKSLDLTIKTSNDKEIVKNIEVKTVTTMNTSNVAKNIGKAKDQIVAGDTVALYCPNRADTPQNRAFIKAGIEEARRKGNIIGPIEVWFNNTKTTKDVWKID